jgi:hypothetical protein
MFLTPDVKDKNNEYITVLDLFDKYFYILFTYFINSVL